MALQTKKKKMRKWFTRNVNIWYLKMCGQKPVKSTYDSKFNQIRIWKSGIKNTFPLQIVNLIHQTGALGGESLTPRISLTSDVQTSAVKQIASLAFRRLCECYETRLKTSFAATQPRPCCVYFWGMWYIKVQTSQSPGRENGWSLRGQESENFLLVSSSLVPVPSKQKSCLLDDVCVTDMIHLMEEGDTQRTKQCE